MKPTVAQKKTAFNIMEAHEVEVVFMNKDGEFFTKKNLAELSVKKKADVVRLYKPILEKELRASKPKATKTAKTTPPKKAEAVDEAKSEDSEEATDSETENSNE
ncbi:hypothetical protein [Flammeovirga sp. SJP92]|uniref:hypothetical protein n=1 Tax=Flammeovirga sp. SJP92 TaxID=1775430 RepID=UPI00078932A0|nr:hypothetical protein [Flammeovirga sp. SJP92]KXX70782.1 hypothetical protein AVL50_07180 [Flammeovirga sp. SJP92]